MYSKQIRGKNHRKHGESIQKHRNFTETTQKLHRNHAETSSIPPMAPAKPKKTVSFSGIAHPVETATASQDSSETLHAPFGLYTMPLHLFSIGYSVLQQDLSPANIVPSLLKHLYVLVASQVAYTLLFVPNLVEIKKNKKRTVKFSLGQDFSLLFIALIVAVVLILPVFVIVVLFGAPVTTYFPENLLLSAHLSLLAYPVIVAFLKVGDRGIFYKYLISIAVGAWFGAVVIPLDWDRPWQNWPLPIVVSAYIGAFLGYTFVGLL